MKRLMRTSSGLTAVGSSGRKPTMRSAPAIVTDSPNTWRRGRRRRQLLDADHGHALDAEEAKHRRAGVRHRHRRRQPDDEHERRDAGQPPPRHVPARPTLAQPCENRRSKIALRRQVENNSECSQVALEVRQRAPPARPAAARARARAATSRCRASSRAQRPCPPRTGRGSTGTRSPRGPRYAAG